MDRQLLSVVSTRGRGRGCIAKNFIKKGQCLVAEDAMPFAPFDHDTCTKDLRGQHSSSTAADEKHAGQLCAKLLTLIDNGELTLETICKRLCRPGDESLGNPRKRSAFYSYVVNSATQALKIYQCYINSKQLQQRKSVMPSLDTCILLILHISCNVFTVVADDEDGGGGDSEPVGVGLFPDAALLNHSCTPNVVQSFRKVKITGSSNSSSSNSRFRIYLRANRDIRPGEECCISYLDIAKPTWWRQQHLLEHYHFYCHCVRCTHIDLYDTMKCPCRCCAGYCTLVIYTNTHTIAVKDNDDTSKIRGVATVAATEREEINQYLAWQSGAHICTTTTTSSAATTVSPYSPRRIPYAYTLLPYGNRMHALMMTDNDICDYFPSLYCHCCHQYFPLMPQARTGSDSGARTITDKTRHQQSHQQCQQLTSCLEDFRLVVSGYERLQQLQQKTDKGGTSVNHRSQQSEILSLYASLIKLLQKYVHCSHYALMELYTGQTVALLTTAQFKQAQEVQALALRSCWYCYRTTSLQRVVTESYAVAGVGALKNSNEHRRGKDSNKCPENDSRLVLMSQLHPSIAIQYVQSGKLLSYLSNYTSSEGRRHLGMGLEMLRVIYGSDSPFVYEVERYLGQ